MARECREIVVENAKSAEMAKAGKVPAVQPEPEPGTALEGLVGTSSVLRAVLARARKVAYHGRGRNGQGARLGSRPSAGSVASRILPR